MDSFQQRALKKVIINICYLFTKYKVIRIIIKNDGVRSQQELEVLACFVNLASL